MSALPPIADVRYVPADVRFVPIADIREMTAWAKRAQRRVLAVTRCRVRHFTGQLWHFGIKKRRPGISTM
jgi:hypothetical protein